jgi:hypothetical protein
MEIIEDLTIIGDDDPDDRSDFSKLVPGDVRVMRQTLYQEGDESWQRADTVGFAHLAVVIGRGGAAICHLVFVFDADDTIVAHGVLPVVGGLDGVGDGQLAVTGGTGAFVGAGGTIEVEVMNPKKYHIVLATPGG